jgi:hypothetical protein
MICGIERLLLGASCYASDRFKSVVESLRSDAMLDLSDRRRQTFTREFDGRRNENNRATNETELYLKMGPNAPDAERLKKTIEELRQKQ